MIGDRWGVTDDEVARSYPCDDFVKASGSVKAYGSVTADGSVKAPALRAWRGVHVQAPPSAVWPWVTQVRIAPYAYDWIDNLGRRSPQRLLNLPEPRVGEAFTTAGGRRLGRIVSVDSERQLTATIMGAFMSYVLVPQEDGATRLLLKVVMPTNRWIAVGLSVGDLVMARRQLLTFKRLAEHQAHQALPLD